MQFPYSLFTFPVSYLIISYILPDTQNSKTFFPFLLSADNLKSYLTEQSEENFHKFPNVYLPKSICIFTLHIPFC